MDVRLPPAPHLGGWARRAGGGASRSTLRPCPSQSIFKNAAVFDQDLNAWDVGSATKLITMFKGAAVFKQSLNSWNVAKVTDIGDMAGLFSGAALFSKEIGSWNTAKVTKMNLMFKDAALFAQNLTTIGTSAKSPP